MTALEVRTAGSAKPGETFGPCVCDVSDESSDVAQLSDFCGPVDVLICNAGVYGPKGPSESVDFREWVRTIEINLFGVVLPCRAVIPGMKAAARHGKIVILSGGGATAPMANISAYAASKAAVVRTMETLAEELKAFRDRCECDRARGALNTRFLDEALEAGPEKVGDGTLRKNAGSRRNPGGVPLAKGALRCASIWRRKRAMGSTGQADQRAVGSLGRGWRITAEELRGSDIYTLRRIVPEDRGKHWD